MSTRVCSMCKEPKEDTTGYVLKSNEKGHTYWSFDMCTECRDEVLKDIRKKLDYADDCPF